MNLATHLEAHATVVGHPILIDENTGSGVDDGIRTESHDPTQLKTRSQAVQSMTSSASFAECAT